MADAVDGRLATLALQLTGVPVLRSHMYISIPAGNFEVARACSGLNYVDHRAGARRAVCLPELLGLDEAAAVRAGVHRGAGRSRTACASTSRSSSSHLTDMRFGPGDGARHFRSRVLLRRGHDGMFWVGRRWRDDAPAGAATTRHRPRVRPAVSHPMWLAALLAAVCDRRRVRSICRLAMRATETQLADESERAANCPPAPAAGPDRLTRTRRVATAVSAARWIERRALPLTRRLGGWTSIVAVYGIGTTGGAEMISFGNRMFAGRARRASDRRASGPSHCVTAARSS